MKILSLICLSVLVLSSVWAQTIQEPETEINFKEEISGEKEGTTLGIIGLGCREKMWVNVYAMANFVEYSKFKEKLSSYKGKSAKELQKDKDFLEAYCKADLEKTMILIMVRDVESAKIEAAFREGLEKSYKDGKLSENAEKLLKNFSNGVKDQDKIVFKYLPGGKLRFHLNKTQADFEDETLAQAVWRIYFTEDPTVGTTMRNQLLSEIHRAWK